MFIFPNTQIEWKGKEYTTKVTFQLIQRIECVFSLSKLATRINSGDVPLSHVATLYGFLLRSGGCDVTNDEINASMMGLDVGSDLTQTEIIQAAISALDCCFPERPKEAKTTKKKSTHKKS